MLGAAADRADGRERPGPAGSSLPSSACRVTVCERGARHRSCPSSDRVAGRRSARRIPRPGPTTMPARDTPGRSPPGAAAGEAQGAHHGGEVRTERPRQPSRQAGRRRTPFQRGDARRPQAHRLRHLGAEERERPERHVPGASVLGERRAAELRAPPPGRGRGCPGPRSRVHPPGLRRVRGAVGRGG